MPKVRMPDGTVVDVGADALFADDGTTPFVAPATPAGPPNDGSQYFTSADVEAARQQEKDKLYSRIESYNEELKALREQVGSLTAAEQRHAAQLEEEKARLEAEARRKEEEDMDAKSLLQRREEDWNSQLTNLNQTWEQRFEAERKEREKAEAIAAREREFNDLRDYTQQQVAANEDKIAPQLLPWITGNSREEVDAAVARAIATTDEITASLQDAFPQQQPLPGQPAYAAPGAPQPPALPGTRVTSGPANSDPAGQFATQLTPEQIANMSMSDYAKYRKQLVGGGSQNNRGLYG